MTTSPEGHPEVVEAELVEAKQPAGAAAFGIDLPEDPEQAIDVLLAHLEESREEASSYLDDLRRVAADFDNYRKRTTREQATTLDRAAERVVRELLPVLDTFDAALGTSAESESERQLLSGMISTREQLLAALEKEGLEVVPTVGEVFDPEIHEPVGAPGGTNDLVVASELRRGYRLRDRVLRPAMVMLEARE
ncbi:MAG TPA: nucleotide exchange factor GrpE [Acidimicrobiia bacterium]|nr:nucleotide exchange factor GrpE [Acidimicrobiia bacterium]